MKASRSPEGPLRRIPVQERSLAKVGRMLDVCAALLDEVGYEGLTTTMVAERAGVAVGSLYQYFPDKRAIVAALAARNMQAYLARVRARLASGAVEGWREITEAAIDDMIDMHRTVPGFRTLRFGDLVDRNLLDEQRNNDKVFADELSLIMATYFDMPDGPQLRMALLIAVELGDALVRLAFRRDPQGDPVILAEARRVICDYLAQKLP